MAVAFHSDSIEIQEEDVENKTAEDDKDYVNVGTRTTAQQKPTQKQSVIGRYRLVVLGFGLLCGVQALLNIGLRLSLSDSAPDQDSRYEDLIKQNNQLQSSHDNLTEQKAQLQSNYDDLTSQKNLIQSNYERVTAERDELKRKLCESCGFQTTFGSSCYYISTEEKTWEESRQWCAGQQSHLIIINSKEEQDFVSRVANRNRDQRVWLGLTDREEEGVWKWVDGTPLTSPTYWGRGEPSGTTTLLDALVRGQAGEDCVEYWNHIGDIENNAGWNDASCFRTKPWICERSL